ncbi:hypothetical protein LIER_40480 [Lithospermum erythrorhizon]|uniref:Uncharacterized protein n=1 Tax=Lithospermum erythrorhizon TaxID=34254 RepID=A0AAV3QV94_LITER
MHFCDIASVSLFTLYFNVYVNGNLAYENLDLSSITYGRLASPFYADFIVDGGSAGVLTVSVGPSNKSSPHAVDGILNGIEVMKINNSMSSFDGKACVGSILKSWEGHRVGYVFPLVAAMFMLLIASVILQRGGVQLRDSVSWSPLPVDASDINMKHVNQLSSGKV